MNPSSSYEVPSGFFLLLH